MKTHRKTYENVFSTDHPKNKSKLNLDKITTGDMDLTEYIFLFKNLLTDSYEELFNFCLRLSWLRRKFVYNGRRMVFPMNKNSIYSSLIFVKFMRKTIGKDLQPITRSRFFSKLELYFDEMYPGFDDGNPFENPDYYKFPFKNISLDFLMAVYQLDDRMDLLKKAEELKMSYAVFIDYVLNHVYSLNDELGRPRYQIKHNRNRNFPFYVRDFDKIENKKI